MAAVEVTKEQKHLFFAYIVKKNAIPHLAKTGRRSWKNIAILGGWRIHKHPPLLGMPLMVPSSEEGNLSAKHWLWDKHRARRLVGFVIP